MNVVAFNGSARRKGNTALLLKTVTDVLEQEGIRTATIDLAGKSIQGCIACMKCHRTKDRRCSVDTDFLNECIVQMDAADGILLGSPTYFALRGVTVPCSCASPDGQRENGLEPLQERGFQISFGGWSFQP